MKERLMNFRKNRQGFTLLELIIVIIIVGVLASVALPRFFQLIEYSKVTEAMVNIQAIRQAIERCYIMTGGGNYGGCTTFPKLAMDDPAQSPNAHFTYGITTYIADPGGNTYELVVTRNTLDGGDINSVIHCVPFEDTKDIACWGYGAFRSLRFGTIPQ